MRQEPLVYFHSPLTIPPSYEQCVEEPIGLRAAYVVSPLELAPLFDWDEDDD